VPPSPTPAPPGQAAEDPSFRLRLVLSDEHTHTDAATAQKVLEAFRSDVRLQGNDPDYHYILGEALAQVGRHDEAVPVLREAIRMSGTEESAYHSALGMSLWSLGDHDAAVAAFREVVRLGPEDVSGLNALGVALTAAANPREAVRVFHAALRLDPRRASVHGNLGVALFACGRHGDAASAFRKAVEHGRDDADAHRNLGLALLASGQPEPAASSLKEATRLRPDDPQGHLELGDVLYGLGRDAEALAAYDEAVRLLPSCLLDRPSSRENREAIHLERLKEEIGAEARPARGAPLWAAFFTGGRVLRGLVPRPRNAAWVLVACLVLGRAGWAVLLPCVDYWSFKDKVSEIAGAPIRGDEEILELVMGAAAERGLEAQVKESSCSVETRGKWRVIRCEYDRQIQLLPGVAPTLHFRFKVERPFFAGETIFT
jgi:Flp pilus assembly protein TadD